MTKILYVLSYLSHNGGVQSVVNNYYGELKNKKDLTIDFLVLLPGDEKMENEIISLGSNVYHIRGSEEKNLFLFMKEINHFFKEHHDYDIIHSHQTNLDFFYLSAAKKYKIPVRIMHAHSTSCSINKLRMYITKKLSAMYSNVHFACSSEAGNYYFGKSFQKNGVVINNAINLEKYIFNENVRVEQREKLNIANSFVIGNVARMDENKNQLFLINVFNEVKKMCSDSKLILVGDGPTKEDLMLRVNELKLSEDVVFYGVTDKAHILYQAMDCYVLPSKYEGVPLTVVEATASGLDTYVSLSIDTHLKNNKYEHKLSLNDNATIWAKEILKNSKGKQRNNAVSVIEQSGFSIKKEAEKLYEKYLELT